MGDFRDVNREPASLHRALPRAVWGTHCRSQRAPCKSETNQQDEPVGWASIGQGIGGVSRRAARWSWWGTISQYRSNHQEFRFAPHAIDDGNRWIAPTRAVRAAARVGWVPASGRSDAVTASCPTLPGAAEPAEVLLDDLLRSLSFATDAVVVADEAGTIVAAGALCEMILGYSPDQLVGRSVEVLLPSRYRSSHRDLRTQYSPHPSPRRMGTGRDLFALHRDGREIAVDVTLSPVQTDRGLVVIAGVRDQTDRYQSRLAVERLAREQTLLRVLATAVAESMPLAAVFGLAVQEVGSLFGGRLSVLVRTSEEAVGHGALIAKSSRGEPSPPGPGDVLVALPSSSIEARATRTRRAARGESAFSPGERGAIAVPVIASGLPWGALVLVGAGGDLDSIAEHLSAVAHLLALAISQTQLRAELVKRAETDPLTQLGNRAAFEDRLVRELEVAEQSTAPLSIAVVDVDHFKQINDRLGHPVGDAALVEVARRIRSALREGDLLCRLGGEEFAAVLPNADSSSAFDIAERLRDAVADTPIAGIGGITVSVGVATLAGEMSSSDLVRRADAAMYRAKIGGRNVTRMAPSDPPAADEVSCIP